MSCDGMGLFHFHVQFVLIYECVCVCQFRFGMLCVMSMNDLLLLLLYFFDDLRTLRALAQSSA